MAACRRAPRPPARPAESRRRRAPRIVARMMPPPPPPAPAGRGRRAPARIPGCTGWPRWRCSRRQLHMAGARWHGVGHGQRTPGHDGPGGVVLEVRAGGSMGKYLRTLASGPPAAGAIKRRVSSRQHSPHLRGVAMLCALCTAAVLVLHGTSVDLPAFEMQMRDLVMRSFTRRAPVDPRLVYLALDNETMNWPATFPRTIWPPRPPCKKWRKAGRGPATCMRGHPAPPAGGSKGGGAGYPFPIPREGDGELKRVLDRYAGQVVIGSNFSDAETVGASRTLTPPAPGLMPTASMTSGWAS